MKLSANFTGVLNRDSDDRFIKPGDYRELENGIIDRDADGGAFILKKLPSSVSVSDINPLGVFVGGKERDGEYFSFFYDSGSHTLSLYKTVLSSGESITIFSRKMEDSYLIDSMEADDYTPPNYEGLKLFSFFHRYVYGGKSYVYIASGISSVTDFSVSNSVISGAPLDDVGDIGNYFRVVNPGYPKAYVISRVPIVVSSEAKFNQTSAQGVIDPFASSSDFGSVFSVVNKGQSNEYIACSLPVSVFGDVEVFDNEDFWAARPLVFEEEGEGPGESGAIYKDVSYSPVDRIRSIDFIVNQASGDLMCYWTDGVNPPFAVNVSFLMRGNTYPHVRDMFNIKPVPQEPKVRFYKDYSSSDSNTRTRNFQFAQRYVYKDGDKTPLSTYTQSAFVPDRIGTSSDMDSANVGYYLQGGVLYKVTGFNTNDAIPVCEFIDPSYDKVLCSKDGSFIFVYTSQGGSKPVKRSFNYGADFEDGPSHQWEATGCMSDDGRYIYMASRHLYMSDDYGKTFDKIEDNVQTQGSLRDLTAMKCSNNGEYVLGRVCSTHRVTDNNPSNPNNYIDHAYSKPFLLTGRGSEFRYLDVALVNDKGTWDERCIGVSESGRNMIYSSGKNVYVSRDFGQTFTSSQSPSASGLRDATIYDNGVGFADRYRTDNFFSSWTEFVAFKFSYRYNYAIIAESGDDYVKYDLSGNEVARISVLNTPSFTDEADVRTLIKSVENLVNAVDIRIQYPGELVDRVEVVGIDTQSGTAYIIGVFDNKDIPRDGLSVKFKNNMIYRVVPDSEKNMLFSNVPKSAKLQSIMGNRLFYFNYREGYDSIPNINFSASVSQRDFREYVLQHSSKSSRQVLLSVGAYEYGIEVGDVLTFSFTYSAASGAVSLISFKHRFNAGYGDFNGAAEEVGDSWKSRFPGGSVTSAGSGLIFALPQDSAFVSVLGSSISEVPLTYKQGRPMTFGLVYYDEYNRGSFPVFGDSDVLIPPSSSAKKSEVSLEIRHTPPSWATAYKVVRTDRDLNYYIVPGFQFVKADRGSIYLMKYDTDVFLPEVGMFLDAITPSGEAISLAVTGKVNREADFVEGSPPGEWIVIEDSGIPGFSVSNINNGSHRFSDTIFYARSITDVADDVLFYEIPGVYRIRDGYHVGNEQDQASDAPAKITIKHDGNCFNIVNANVELINIGGDLTFVNGGRPIIELESPREVHHYSGITVSGMFVQEYGINGLSTFNPLELGVKSLEAVNGPITAVEPKETNVMVWQEDAVGYVLVNKNMIYSSDGASTIGQSSDIMGEYIMIPGKYGTLHSDSVDSWGGVSFFVDAKRRVVCSVSRDGVSEISVRGMDSLFNSLISRDDDYKVAFHPGRKEFWLYVSSEQKIYVYSQAREGWVRTIKPYGGFVLSSLFASDSDVFSVDGGVVWKEMARNAAPYGVVHDMPAPMSMEFVINEHPSIMKVAEAIELESNREIPVRIIVGGAFDSKEMFNEAEITTDMYEFREGEYFSYVPGANNDSVGASDGVIIPIGRVASISGNEAEIKGGIGGVIGHINHDVFISKSGHVTRIGELGDEISISDGKLIWSGMSSSFLGGLVFLVEKSYLNGHKLRAPFFRVRFADDSGNWLGVFSFKLKVNKSFNE